MSSNSDVILSIFNSIKGLRDLNSNIFRTSFAVILKAALVFYFSALLALSPAPAAILYSSGSCLLHHNFFFLQVPLKKMASHCTLLLCSCPLTFRENCLWCLKRVRERWYLCIVPDSPWSSGSTQPSSTATSYDPASPEMTGFWEGRQARVGRRRPLSTISLGSIQSLTIISQDIWVSEQSRAPWSQGARSPKSCF